MGSEPTKENDVRDDATDSPTGTTESKTGGEMNSSNGDDDDDETRFTVYWNNPESSDPENPLNWSETKKWANIGILSVLTFLTPLASSMLAPGVPHMLADFGASSSESSATFVVSIFILGFAVGPLLWAPLSELRGRLPVYHAANPLFLAFTLACGASRSVGQMLAFRFLAGFAGCAVVTCGGASIADLTTPASRGRRMAVWSAGPLLGPVVGPVCAGFLVERLGWRWIFWVTGVAAAAAVLASFVFLGETYAPVILERKAAKLRKETGDERYRSRLERSGTSGQLFRAAIIRPARLFCTSPIVCVLCIYIAVVYGLLYILFTTFTFVYTDIYNFNAVGAGLSFIAGGVGNLIGLGYVGYSSDKIIQKRQQTHGKDEEEAQDLGSSKLARPETRLNPMLTVPTTLSLSAGLIMYGWTAQARLHWIVPMIGTGVMGFGMIGIFMVVQTYLIEAFTPYAASVTAANAVLRSILGALLPLCGLQVYDALGLGWGNTMLGLIALAFAPVPWVLYKYGSKIRESPRFQIKA